MTTHRVIVQTAGNPDQFRTQHAKAYNKTSCIMLTYLTRVYVSKCEQCIILKSNDHIKMLLGMRLVGDVITELLVNFSFGFRIVCNCIAVTHVSIDE